MSSLRGTFPNETEPMKTTELAIAHYEIDPGISRFTVRAFASGLLSAFGHGPTFAIREFEGEVQLAADSLEGAGLRLKINAASLYVQDEISDKDRREMERMMNREVLETQRFPEVVYECSSVTGAQTGPGQYTVKLNGQLTMHGVTRNQPVDARVNIDGTMLRASGEFTARQTDYDIKLVSAVAGSLKVKDELKLAFAIAARKQQPKLE